MKPKRFLIYFLVIIISLVVNSSSFEGDTYVPKEGFVPDALTAIKIAEAVWLPIYGKEIYKTKPFSAKLIKNEIWIVKGKINTGLGGVPYAEINKADCKILRVYHTL